MGLDQFTEDDTSTAESNNRSKRQSKSVSKDNSPTNSIQRFADIPHITPRSIKFQVKSIGTSWVTQFSTKRFSGGELILYGAQTRAKKSDKAVVVYTTITSEIDDTTTEENKPIRVVCYDFDKDEEITDGVDLEHTMEWNKDLYNAVMDEMNTLIDITD